MRVGRTADAPEHTVGLRKEKDGGNRMGPIKGHRSPAGRACDGRSWGEPSRKMSNSDDEL